MLKKYYILALTFLCLFLGQVSYGLNINEGHEDDWLAEAIEAGATVSVYDSLEKYAAAHNIDGAIDTNGDGTFSTSEIASYMFGFEISEVTTFAHETAYMLSNGDLLLLSSLLNEVVVVKASNNNNSSGSTDTTTTVPDPTDPPCIGCPDPCIGCDGDLPPVKEPCIKTCDSGYKLNMDTCECVLLPPCWGTTVEELMPDGSGDQSQLVKALEAMVNSFFKSSDLLDTMKAIGILDPAELSKGFDNYLDGGDWMGLLSIGFVANEYNNNPTTENLMKVFVEGALLALPPPASVGYTALDTLYQKYIGDKSFADTLAKKMAEKSAELFDCDLGSGVYGMFN